MSCFPSGLLGIRVPIPYCPTVPPPRHPSRPRRTRTFRPTHRPSRVVFVAAPHPGCPTRVAPSRTSRCAPQRTRSPTARSSRRPTRVCSTGSSTLQSRPAQQPLPIPFLCLTTRTSPPRQTRRDSHRVPAPAPPNIFSPRAPPTTPPLNRPFRPPPLRVLPEHLRPPPHPPRRGESVLRAPPRHLPHARRDRPRHLRR